MLLYLWENVSQRFGAALVMLELFQKFCHSLRLSFFFFFQLQEILRERICRQQLPVRPEGVEAQHKWDFIIFITFF